MRKCFKFTVEASSTLGTVYRPIAKIRLRDASGNLFEMSVIVDSGADISMFSRRLGDIMGINVENGEAKTFRGIVGEVIAYVHRIPIIIGEKEVSAAVAFALADVPNLLGRLDIFENFDIHFMKEKEVCFIN